MAPMPALYEVIEKDCRSSRGSQSLTREFAVIFIDGLKGFYKGCLLKGMRISMRVRAT